MASLQGANRGAEWRPASAQPFMGDEEEKSVNGYAATSPGGGLMIIRGIPMLDADSWKPGPYTRLRLRPAALSAAEWPLTGLARSFTGLDRSWAFLSFNPARTTNKLVTRWNVAYSKETKEDAINTAWLISSFRPLLAVRIAKKSPIANCGRS
jgi:hypothetical protein